MALLPRSGTILVREWQGTSHDVTVVDGGFLWKAKPIAAFLASPAHNVAY
jgi:hypothetical protein